MRTVIRVLKLSIYYDGSKLNLETGALLSTKTGGNCALDPSNARYTCTGYYTRKFSHYKSGRSGNLDGYFKEFRLAELYLNYAEAANEASTTGTVPNDAVDAVNAVRSRVGMPGIPYGLSCDQFRLRIRERKTRRTCF